MTAPAAPYVLSMIVCDAIHRDPATGKHTILGTFSALASRDFPAMHPMLCTYIALTDGRGTVPLTLKLIDADEENEPLLTARAEMPFPDPRAVVELTLALERIRFPQPGEYRLILEGAGEFLMERRIVVKQAK